MNNTENVGQGLQSAVLGDAQKNWVKPTLERLLIKDALTASNSFNPDNGTHSNS